MERTTFQSAHLFVSNVPFPALRFATMLASGAWFSSSLGSCGLGVGAAGREAGAEKLAHSSVACVVCMYLLSQTPRVLISRFPVIGAALIPQKMSPTDLCY